MKRFFLILAAALLLTVSAAAYDDVPAGHWAADAIGAMEARHVASGFPDGTFRPGLPVSRVQFTAMILRAFSGEALPQAEDGDPWWQPYYEAAVQSGLLSAGDGPLFSDSGSGPTDGLTRYEMAVILDNACFLWNGLRLTPGWEQPGRFTDSGEFPARYAAGVEASAAAGLLSGYPDGSFQGEQAVTRAEACLAVQRLLHQGALMTESERQAVFTGGILIKYALDSDGSATLSSIRLCDGAVLQAMRIPMDAFLGFDTLRRSDRQQWVSRWGRTVSGADHSAFWGEIGYYTYEADGSFSQWTDRAVYGRLEESGGSVLAVSHRPGRRVSFSSGGTEYPAGDQVIRLRQDGSVELLLEDAPAHGLALTAVTRAEGAAVFVRSEALSGMAGRQIREYAVEHGRLRPVVHTPGSGYSGFTPEEAAAEQARLDAAGAGSR